MSVSVFSWPAFTSTQDKLQCNHSITFWTHTHINAVSTASSIYTPRTMTIWPLRDCSNRQHLLSVFHCVDKYFVAFCLIALIRALLCCVVLCRIVLRCVVLCCVVLRCVVLGLSFVVFFFISHRVVCPVLRCCVSSCWVVLCCVVSCHVVLSRVVLCWIAVVSCCAVTCYLLCKTCRVLEVKALGSVSLSHS